MAAIGNAKRNDRALAHLMNIQLFQFTAHSRRGVRLAKNAVRSLLQKRVPGAAVAVAADQQDRQRCEPRFARNWRRGRIHPGKVQIEVGENGRDIVPGVAHQSLCVVRAGMIRVSRRASTPRAICSVSAHVSRLPRSEPGVSEPSWKKPVAHFVQRNEMPRAIDIGFQFLTQSDHVASTVRYSVKDS